MNQMSRKVDLDRIHTKLLNLGLLLDVFVPVVLLFLGIFLRSQGVMIKSFKDLDILLWGLLAVSGGDVLAIYWIKKKILYARKVQKMGEQSVPLERMQLRSGLIVFSLGLSPAIYGLVYFLLGGTKEKFVLFLAIPLLCFLLFKPKLEEMKSLNNSLPHPSNDF